MEKLLGNRLLFVVGIVCCFFSLSMLALVLYLLFVIQTVSLTQQQIKYMTEDAPWTSFLLIIIGIPCLLIGWPEKKPNIDK